MPDLVPPATDQQTSPASAISGRFKRAASVLGLAAVVGIGVLLNSFAARFDRRWDLTSDHRYTPPTALRRLLESATDSTTATVLLSHDDPVAPTLELLLSSYHLVNRRLTVDWVDPDRDPVRFLARQAELGLHPGRTEDGQVTSDAIVVVSARHRHYYIEASDIVGLDPDAAEGTGAFEQAFAKALRSVYERELPTLCFTEGSRELSLNDRSPLGLSSLKERLERESIKVLGVDANRAASDAFENCRLVVVAAPDVALAPEALQRLLAAGKRASLLLLGGVVPDDAGQLHLLGVETLAQLGGIEVHPDVVVETNASFKIPNTFGETFLAEPAEHASTRGLRRGPAESPLRVVVTLAQSLSKRSGSRALALLTSSDGAIAITDVAPATIARVETGTPSQPSAKRVVAMAGPVDGALDDRQRIAVAPANLIQNRSFDNPAYLSTQAFALSLISWLTESKTSDIALEPRPSRAPAFELSADELTQITRYTALVMPLCFLLAGVAVLQLRRKSQRAPRGPGGVS
jgi:hypothetical protein